MIFKNFRVKPQQLPSGSPGKRLYAIGDVHGCYKEMCTLLELIEQDNTALEPKECIIVFLGDLIDRGPASQQVIEHLIVSPPKFASTYHIVGNHEEMFLRALLDEPTLIPQWLSYGGGSFVESYGLDPDSLKGLDPAFMQVVLKKYIPKEHIEFMQSMLECINFGDYFLVHAGVDPSLGRDEQDPRQLRWMREPFLSYDKPLGYMVVHGHTIIEHPIINVNRVSVDTGCYKTGVLTAAVIEDQKIRTLSTSSL